MVQFLQVTQFKNYKHQSFVFDKRIVCIYGANGSGKTSILDAIHFLCFTKSYFQHIDSLCVMNGEHGMRIEGKIQGDKLYEVICVLREHGKKEFSVNGQQYNLFSKHLGKFPCVFIAPDDVQLILDGSEVRRKFLDSMICQIDESYLQRLIQYNKCLLQRNALLKQWANVGERDFSLLSIYSKTLHELGTEIHTKRKDYVDQFVPLVLDIYKFLCEDSEEIRITYRSQLNDDSLLDMLDRYIDKDIITQRTNYGIHKDDLLFELQGMPLKASASQGQRKSFLFSLKLAQFEWIQRATNKAPILLLDDIFEKLDADRSAKLISYLVQQKAQIFISDTHKERLESAFINSVQEVAFLGL